MHVSTKALVLSKIKYKDNDLIVKCYTQDLGISSYIIKNAVKTRKGKFKPAYFQPLTLLKIQAEHKDNRSLNYFRDIHLHYNYNTLHSNITKSTIIMFLSEILSNILKEEEENLQLYDFLETALIWFDESETNSNFHLIFLLKLTKYLGFYPEMASNNLAYFNLEQGRFQQDKTSKYCISGNNLKLLKQLLGIKFDASKSIEINSTQKRDFLSMILLYFKLHLHGFKQPKSVAILNQVFS